MASERANKREPETQSQEEARVQKLAQQFEEMGKGTDSRGKEIQVSKIGPIIEKKDSHSLEDIGRYRAQAQQNSIEAIRGAEERYAKAKEDALKGAKGGQGGGEKGYTAAATETIASIGKTVIDYTKHAAGQAKDVAVSTGAPAVHYVGEKMVGVKDTTVDVGKKAVDYAGEKAVQARDTTVEAGKKAASATVEVGKSAAGYAGTKAVEVKDVTVEKSMRAAHYTLGKTVEATDATAGLGRRSLEATGQKAEVAGQEALQKEQEAKEYAAKLRNEQEQGKSALGKDIPGEQQTTTTGGSLIGAVGETLVEIMQSTKGMVIGDDSNKKV